MTERLRCFYCGKKVCGCMSELAESRLLEIKQDVRRAFHNGEAYDMASVRWFELRVLIRRLEQKS